LVAVLLLATLVLSDRPAQAAEPPVQLASISFLSGTTGFVALQLLPRGTDLIHTSNAGVTWTHHRLAVDAAQVHSVDRRHAWITSEMPVGCMDTATTVACDGAVLWTDNGGYSWRTVLRTPGTEYRALQYLGTNRAWFYALRRECTPYCPVVTTRDAGRSWHVMTSAPRGTNSLHFIDGRTGWAAGTAPCDPYNRMTRSQVSVTHDGGATWRTQLVVTGRCDAMVDFVNDKVGWVLLGATPALCSMGGCDGYRLYHTVDGGANWRLQQGTVDPRGSTTHSWWGQEGFPLTPSFISPRVGGIAFDGGAGPGFGGLLLTTDGGAHWRRTLPRYQPAGQNNWSLVGPRTVWFTGCYMHEACRQLLRSTTAGRTWIGVTIPQT
jgi:photosystem II stability/assembly factor-like uncharacterized protein